MPEPKQRLLSLDAFRGITIAGMILVNNPGDWTKIYAPFRHAHWHGLTPTDLVFPFFLFIVGVAMAFSFGKRREKQAGDRLAVLTHVVRRALVLFLLGLIMYGFPDPRLIGPYIAAIVGISLAFTANERITRMLGGATALRMIGGVIFFGSCIWFALDIDYFHHTGLRVPGVLQRIAACYLVASLIVIFTGIRGTAIAALLILVAYPLILANVSPPEGYTADVTGPEGLLHNWVDEQLLDGHLYGHRPDPEGLLSTLPAVATTLLGILTGAWLRKPRERQDALVGLFVAGAIALFAGWCMAPFIPLNKQIWTSSYVVMTAGLALEVLAMCYWLIDLRGRQSWAKPFLVFGSNAIVVFVASSLMAKMFVRWHVSENGPTVKGWIYSNVFKSWASPEQTASLLYALSFVTLWLLLMIPLYRRRIFVKV